MSLPSTSQLRLAVVFGGRSSEHGVSCLTAANVLEVVDHDRFDVTPIGITVDGDWVRESASWPDLAPGTLPAVRPEMKPFEWDDLRDFDVVLPLLHGPWGEDGTIQGLFEMAGVHYVGAGVLASSVAMDKPFTKTVFSAAGLPQVPHVTVQPRMWERERDRVMDRIKALGLPVFVKPARGGSSSGVLKVDVWDEVEPAIMKAQDFDPKVLVESAVHGRELECGVIQELDGTTVASVVGEIVVRDDSGHEFYDFEAKYLDGTSTLFVPADIPEVLAERIRAYAVQAFDALGCEGLARVDFFLGDDGEVVVNEINTMPGFTPYSMFPLLWEASGLTYAELIDRLLQLALDRPLGLR
jgi:D-alanine-D-alanine ligase